MDDLSLADEERRAVRRFRKTLRTLAPGVLGAVYATLTAKRFSPSMTIVEGYFLQAIEDFISDAIHQMRRRELEQLLTSMLQIVDKGEATEKTRALVQIADRRRLTLLAGRTNPKPMPGGAPGSRR